MKPDLHSNLASELLFPRGDMNTTAWFITFHMSTGAGFSCGLDSPTLDLPRMSVPKTSFPMFFPEEGGEWGWSYHHQEILNTLIVQISQVSSFLIDPSK